jgi:hypothetical protein
LLQKVLKKVFKNIRLKIFIYYLAKHNSSLAEIANQGKWRRLAVIAVTKFIWFVKLAILIKKPILVFPVPLALEIPKSVF